MKAWQIQQFADMLYDAEQKGLPIEPLTEQDAGLNVDDAYAIQMCNVQRALAAGRIISGKKIGLTSLGIQQQLGVSEPDYGHLFADMNCLGGTVDTAALLQPKIEAELAFVLAEELTGGNVTAQDVKDATEYVAGAFEIVDSRVADWRIKLPDTVADNASSGRYILGTTRLRAQDVDLPQVNMRMYKNSRPAGEGSGSAVLGDPAVSVAWLANCLHRYGVSLKKGEVILSGAFSAAPAAQKGDIFRVEFSSLGTVEAEFI